MPDLEPNNPDYFIPVDMDSIVNGLDRAYEYITDSDENKRKIGQEILRITAQNLRLSYDISASRESDEDTSPQSIELPPLDYDQDNYDLKALEIFDQLRDSVHDGIFVIDEGGSISLVNKAMEKITGYEKDKLIGMQYQELVHSEDYTDFIDRIVNSKTSDHTPHEFRVVGKDGQVRWVRVSTYTIESQTSEERKEIAGLMVDITEAVELKSKLERMSLYDSLTGLASRHYLDIELEKLKVSRRYPISFINIDIDDFKTINDTYGHATGDETLKIVALFLLGAVREEDFVARAGGDEFVIPLPETGLDKANEIVERIKSTFYMLNLGETNQLNVSVGVATAATMTEFDTAYQQADEAMYKEKKAKKTLKVQDDIAIRFADEDIFG